MTHLERTKINAARLSIGVGVSLVITKAVIGLLTHSVSIKGEAVHSATDVVASLVAFVAIRKATVPADDDHPYGHGKIESLSGLAEAIIIGAAAIAIAVEATRSLLGDEPNIHVGVLGIGIMIASASANFAVATHLSSVARKSDSPALAADAKHLMVDVWTSMGVLAGLVATKITGYNRIDAIIGFAVSLMVLNAAWHIGRGAVDFLLDGRLPDDEIVRIERIFNEDERVLGFHKLRTRKSGADRHVDVHIQVDDDLSLRAAHQITEELEDEIRKVLPNTEVVIHTEPFHEEQLHQMEIEHRRGREGGIITSKR